MRIEVVNKFHLTKYSTVTENIYWHGTFTDPDEKFVRNIMLTGLHFYQYDKETFVFTVTANSLQPRPHVYIKHLCKIFSWLTLNVPSSNFTHQSVSPGVGKYCMCEKKL